jgi:hypothetical protein
VNGGFSSAGAIRTPQTINGLVAVPEDQTAHSLAVPTKKSAEQVKSTAPKIAHDKTSSDVIGQPSVTVAK